MRILLTALWCLTGNAANFSMSEMTPPRLEIRQVMQQDGTLFRYFVEVLSDGTVNDKLGLSEDGTPKNIKDPRTESLLYESWKNWSGRPDKVSKFMRAYEAKNFPPNTPAPAPVASGSHSDGGTNTDGSHPVSDAKALTLLEEVNKTHDCDVAKQIFAPQRIAGKVVKTEVGRAEKCKLLVQTGYDNYQLNTYDGKLPEPFDRGTESAIGLTVNGKEAMLDITEYCVNKKPAARSEGCQLSSHKPPGNEIQFYGSIDPNNKSRKPKLMVVRTFARQAPGASGIAAIDRDRERTYRTKGFFRQNADFDVHHGAMVVRIENGKLCPVAAIRMTPRRSSLLRLTQGRDYFPDRTDEGSNRPGARERSRLSAEYEARAEARLEKLVQSSQSIPCDSVTADQIRKQLDSEQF